MSDDRDESRDAAEPADTVIEHVEGSGDAETEFNPFEEIQDEFRPGPAMRVMGPDGMPLTVDTTTNGDDLPVLSTETLVCMGIFSKFVQRDKWGRIEAEFTPKEVTRMPNGEWVVTMKVFVERMKLHPDEQFWNGASEYHAVAPIRPPCRHYVRQLGSFEYNAKHQVPYRLCAARRTTEGTFMSVRDTGLWACDMREPYELESVERHLDSFDTMKSAQGAKRQHLPMFQGFGGGIFDPTSKPTKES